MTTETAPTLTQDDVLAKLYTDLTRLAGEIAVDRCRMAVLTRLVKEHAAMNDDELDGLFRAEIEASLEAHVRGITAPMVADMQEPEMGGCCGGRPQ